MTNLNRKNILLGVTGGIAAYKAAELVRLLRKKEANVQIAMTKAATEFVAPLTFQALSGNPVILELLDPNQEASMGHINLARWAERLVIAPASADFIAKLRIGLADDLLSTLCLATRSPILLAPAMNQGMWQNPATQDNIETLKTRGMSLLGPDVGDQACGEIGLGRMLEPVLIVEELERLFSTNQGEFSGLSILISAGPTREAIDPVRFISNRSSGKMGYEIAKAAADAGARVTLVSGPVNIKAPSVAELIQVETASEMLEAVLKHAPFHQIYIGSAAVADYSPTEVFNQKLKKQNDTETLTLKKTADILSSVARLKDKPFVVGFAAETHDLERYARHKLEEKSLDMIAANWAGRPGVGFDSEDNALTVYWPSGKQHLEKAPKSVLARRLLDLVTQNYNEQSRAENS